MKLSKKLKEDIKKLASQNINYTQLDAELVY